MGKCIYQDSRHKKNSEKFVVGNTCIYRVPTKPSENLQICNEDFAETLEILQTMRSHVYIGGDFNIVLLKINQKRHYNALRENLVTAGYLPRITLPTRITDHSATLLDNIFTNVLEEHTSGVIINSISDHQMISTYRRLKYNIPNSIPIEIEGNDAHSIQNFVTKFQDYNLQNN